MPEQTIAPAPRPPAPDDDRVTNAASDTRDLQSTRAWRVWALLTGPTGRGIAYLIALAGLATALIFKDLQVDTMGGDEAVYALVVEHIRSSGRWMVLHSVSLTEPYWHKPPGMIWLTAATYDSLPDGLARYRFWSAAAGVACVVVTAYAAAVMLGSAELGLLAGLILLTNTRFLFSHGARFGGFDTGLTLAVLLAMLCYWAALNGRRRWAMWVAIGALAGVATSLKPPLGVVLCGFVGLHALAFDRRCPLLRRWVGPAVATVIGLAVASPWYVGNYLAHGQRFVDVVFWWNIVQRGTEGVDGRHLHDRLYYVRQLSAASVAYALFVPGLLMLLLGAAWRGAGRVVSAEPSSTNGAAVDRRPAYGLLATFGVGWVVLFTAITSKQTHYAYPALPMGSIGIAALVLFVVDRATRWAAGDPGIAGRFAGLAVGVVVAGLLVEYVRTTADVPRRARAYEPWNLYQALEPALADRRLDVAFAGMDPAGRAMPGAGTRDLIHLSLMRHDRVAPAPTADDLVIAAGRPTLLFVARPLDPPSFLSARGLDARSFPPLAFDHPLYAMRAVDAEQLLAPVATPDRPAGRSLRLLPAGDAAHTGTWNGDFDGRFTCDWWPAAQFDAQFVLRLQPPTDPALAQRPGAQWVSVTVRDPRGVTVSGTVIPWFVGSKSGGGQDVPMRIAGGHLKPRGGPTRFVIDVRWADETPMKGAPVAARVESVRVGCDLEYPRGY